MNAPSDIDLEKHRLMHKFMGNNYFNACTVVNENSCQTPALRTHDRFQDIIVMS